jgi:serine/threonine protein kinase
MSSTVTSSHPTEVAAGRYRIRRLLGISHTQGAYLAHDRDLDREVVLSLLRLDTTDHFAPRRILEEARAMARLGGHPRVVTIHDVGDEDGQPFVVSQYMAGGTLAERLRQSPQGLPVGEALRIAEQLCHALEHAHAHGIVHRDLTPRKVWLDAEGFAKVGGFALPPAAGARRPDESAVAYASTRRRAALGTSM